MLKEKINQERITALKLGETFRKATLSLILAAIKQVEVDKRKELTNEEIIQVLTKMVKQRQDSIQQYQSAERHDLADIEINEKNIIEEFLPTQLSEEEIRTKIKELVTPEMNIGEAMKIVKPEFVGKADMGLVSKIVKEVI